jgi:hypothetical protein
MSALGQKQTLQCACTMSALPPIADVSCCLSDVRFGPIAAVATQVPRTGEKPGLVSLYLCAALIGNLAASMNGNDRYPSPEDPL